MRPLYLLFLIAIVFTSCSDWKYSNGTKWNQPKPVSADQSSIPAAAKERIKVLSSMAEEETETAPVMQASDADSLATVEEKIEIIVNPAYVKQEVFRLENDSDSIAKQEEIVRQAFNAEKKGKKSTIFGILGLVLTFSPFFLVGTVLAIIGLTKSVSALKERYNTPKGLRYARVGAILSSIALGLTLLAILITLAILIILL